MRPPTSPERDIRDTHRRAAARGVFACALLSALGTIARAEEGATVQIANQLEAYYDTKLEESVIDDRLDAGLTYGPYSIGAEFLSHSPSDPIWLDPNDFGAQTQGLRKRWIAAESNGWSVRLGDVYGTLGRGLALSIFEDQVVDFDNALDGVQGEAAVGPASLKVIAGTNSFDEAAQVVKGAEARVALPRGTTLGMEGVLLNSVAHGPADRPLRDQLGGAHAATSLGSIADLYGEYVLRSYRYYEADPKATGEGHAGYASATWYLGRVQVLSEFKDLLRYKLLDASENGFTASTPSIINPPTAIRQHASTLLNRGGHTPNIDLNDERGGKVEALVTVDDKTHLTGAFGRTEARHRHQPSREAYGEIERWLTDRAEVIAKFGETEEIVIEGGEEIFTERITYAGTLLVPWNDTWSTQIDFETQGTQEQNRATRDFQEPLEFRDNLLSLTVSRAPNMSFALTSEWSDSPKEVDDFWMWGECNLRLGDRHQLLLGGGKLRGGQLCSGGVCKLVDPFEGGRIEFLTTF